MTNTGACGALPNWDPAGMLSLTTLDLSNNKLSGSLPEAWGQFSDVALTSTTLAGNDGICGRALASWNSAALVDAAASANAALVAATCADAPVACKAQGHCSASSGDGVAPSALTVLAWAVTALVAYAAL